MTPYWPISNKLLRPFLFSEPEGLSPRLDCRHQDSGYVPKYHTGVVRKRPRDQSQSLRGFHNEPTCNALSAQEVTPMLMQDRYNVNSNWLVRWPDAPNLGDSSQIALHRPYNAPSLRKHSSIINVTVNSGLPTQASAQKKITSTLSRFSETDFSPG